MSLVEALFPSLGQVVLRQWLGKLTINASSDLAKVLAFVVYLHNPDHGLSLTAIPTLDCEVSEKLWLPSVGWTLVSFSKISDNLANPCFCLPKGAIQYRTKENRASLFSFTLVCGFEVGLVIQRVF